MITYIDDLYLTEKSRQRETKIKQDISRKAFFSRACIITLSFNENDTLDIIPIINMRMRTEVYQDICILGIAESKKAAMKLCHEMIVEYISQNTDMSMRKYFEGKITALNL